MKSRKPLTKFTSKMEGNDDYLELVNEQGDDVQDNDSSDLDVGDADHDELQTAARSGRVMYIGHLPEGFFEKEMGQYFSQFGHVKNVKGKA